MMACGKKGYSVCRGGYKFSEKEFKIVSKKIKIKNEKMPAVPQCYSIEERTNTKSQCPVLGGVLGNEGRWSWVYSTA